PTSAGGAPWKARRPRRLRRPRRRGRRPARMTNLDIAHRRLHNQLITHPTFDKPDDVVRWLVAVQAQDYPGALWAVGLRMRDATETAIEQAIAERTIVRTWPMRGTLHFVAPEDVRWMLQLLTPRII